MTTKNVPNEPSQSVPRADAGIKPLPFAFPFLRKGRGGQSEASAKFTDEHEFYRLLAEREPSGTYLVSNQGLWHGGIHVTEAGAGQAFDLDAGVRCIADGYVIAYRLERTHSVSDGPTGGQAPYSTSFALVRHAMAFPKGTTLTFYSLYMHLSAYEDYERAPVRQRPAYWSTRLQVSEFAKDKPSTGRNGQSPDAAQRGLRVRRSPPDGGIIGILPQGATVTLGQRQNGWGRIEDLHGRLYTRRPPACLSIRRRLWADGSPLARKTVARSCAKSCRNRPLTGW